MTDYQALYTTLFNAITDAITQLQAENYGLARDLLVQAQQEAELRYINEED